MTERIHDFLRRRRDEGLDDGPCLVVDLDIVRENYRAFAKALPDSRLRMQLHPRHRDRQPEANRRTPRSTGDAA